MKKFQDGIKIEKFSDYILVLISCLFLPAIISAILMSFRQTASAAFLWLFTSFIAYNYVLGISEKMISFGSFFFFYYLATSISIFFSVVLNKKNYS